MCPAQQTSEQMSGKMNRWINEREEKERQKEGGKSLLQPGNAPPALGELAQEKTS